MSRLVSIAFQTDKRASDYIALAQLVDQYEIDVVSVYCDAPYHPSYVPLVLMAPHIRRARLGPAAVSPFRIHPIDIAAQTALLADLAAGGVYIGLARGAWLADHGIPEADKPITALREAITIIRTLLSGRSAGFDGEVYRIAPHVRAPYPLPEHPIPLMIGTWGAKLASLGGEVADEVKVGGSANPDLVPVMLAYIRKGERLAGREEGSVGLVVGAVTVVDPDRETARQFARRKVALYLPVVASLDPTLEVDPQLLATIQAAVESNDLDRAGRQISDDLLDRFAFAGNAEDIIRQAESLYAAGATRLEFGTPHGIDPAAGVRMLGEQVVPILKRNHP